MTKRLSFLFTFALFLAFAGCGSEPEKPGLKQSDRVVLRFYGEQGKDISQSITFTLDDPKLIERLSGIIEGEDAGELKCAYTGEMNFYLGDSLLLSGEFNLDESCRHFVFMTGDKLNSVKMNADVLRILDEYKAKSARGNFADLSWILGKWMLDAKGVNAFEEWKAAGDKRFVGRAYDVKGKDTTFAESLELVSAEDGIYYIPTVGEQGPVKFRLTRMEENFVVFENPEHDFPTKISYEKVKDRGILAVIEGKAANGETVKKEFPFVKAE